MERKVIITLFDREFSFYTDAPEEEVTQVISLVRDELQSQTHTGGSALPDSKILILACLRLAARFVEQEKEHQAFKAKQENSIDNLSQKVSLGAE